MVDLQSEQPVLEISNVTKLYKNGRGIENISLSLKPGEVLGLLGPNGSGKTTTMKVIAGLLVPDSGQVTVCGCDAAANHEQVMQNMGCLIEAPALYDYLTVKQNMQIAARFYRTGRSAETPVGDAPLGVPRHTTKPRGAEGGDPYISPSRITEVLQMVEMEKYQQDKVRSLSLGMRQRVGLALALYNKPRLLILDEPSNGLDIEGIRYVREVIQQSARDGIAVLVSSHLAAELQECATKVAIIRTGKLLACDSMENVLGTAGSLEEYFLHATSKNPNPSFRA